MDLEGERLGADSVKDISEVAVVDNDDSVEAVVDNDDSVEAVVDNDDSVEAVVVTGNDVDSSGSCVNERIGERVDSGELGDEGNHHGEQLCSPGVNSASPGGSLGSTPKKGYGLKKWKRFRREGVVRSVSPSLDTGKVLKRGVSGINDSSSQSPKLADGKQGAGDFVKTQFMNTLDNNLAGLSYSPAPASSSTVFAMGAVSENSEDRSSKSSTAASAPRHVIGLHTGSPISGDKKKPKNPSGKGFNNSTQMGHLGKGRTDPSKKLRGGERVRYEKQVSHSSLESDSRSSNLVFIQTSNRRQSEASVNYNEESDEDILGEPHFTDDQMAYNQAHAGEAGDILPRDLGADFSWDGNDGNHQSPSMRDPLAESIGTLDSVREAIEKELQKFREIGNESHFTSADTAVSLDSSEYLNGEDLTQNENGSLTLAEKITYLESALEESRNASRIKDLKVSELEVKLQTACPHNGDTNIKTQRLEETKKLESEFEILFAQKLEADFKCIVLVNAISDAETLLSEQKTLAEEQLKLTTRLEQTESKAVKIKQQAKELETHSADIVEIVDAEYVKRRISKLTRYSLTQLLLLLVALWTVYSQLISDSGVVVPT